MQRPDETDGTSGFTICTQVLHASPVGSLAVTEQSPEIGVGPWPGEWPAPELVGTRYDPELLRLGDRRNVVDRYRYWLLEAIVADLDSRRAGLQVGIENLAHDFNIGSVVRTANAFNVAGVHVVGRRRWNRRGAMVTDRYLTVQHHDDPAALAAWCAQRELPLIGVDNVEASEPLETVDLPERVLLLFGQESTGLSEAAQAHCQSVLSIYQDGSTRSMNVGAAAAIALHAWVRRWRFDQRVDQRGSGRSGRVEP